MLKNNLETIDMNDFEKLEDTVAPSHFGQFGFGKNHFTSTNYNLTVTNNVTGSYGTCVSNNFTFN